MTRLLIRLMNADRAVRIGASLGALALLLWLIGLGIFAFAAEISAKSAAIAEARASLAKLERFIEANRESNLSDIPARPTIPADLFILASNENLARAMLQRKLTSLASGNQVAVSSLAALPQDRLKHVQLVGIAAELSGPMERILGLLQAMDRSRPALIVDRVDVRGGQNTTNPSLVTCRIEIRALMANPSEASTGSGS